MDKVHGSRMTEIGPGLSLASSEWPIGARIMQLPSPAVVPPYSCFSRSSRMPSCIPFADVANSARDHNAVLRRRAEASLRLVSGQLLHTQDEERRRIARDLHDSVGQILAARA